MASRCTRATVQPKSARAKAAVPIAPTRRRRPPPLVFERPSTGGRGASRDRACAPCTSRRPRFVKSMQRFAASATGRGRSAGASTRTARVEGSPHSRRHFRGGGSATPRAPVLGQPLGTLVERSDFAPARRKRRPCHRGRRPDDQGGRPRRSCKAGRQAVAATARRRTLAIRRAAHALRRRAVAHGCSRRGRRPALRQRATSRARRGRRRGRQGGKRRGSTIVYAPSPQGRARRASGGGGAVLPAHARRRDGGGDRRGCSRRADGPRPTSRGRCRRSPERAPRRRVVRGRRARERGSGRRGDREDSV